MTELPTRPWRRFVLTAVLAGSLAAPVPSLAAPWPTAPEPPPRASLVASKVAPAKLNEAQKAALARVQAYLNDIRTLRAHFLQLADNGSTAEGEILISRPGLMKIAYAPPSPHLIVADGIFLIYHEKRLNQTSYIPLSSSLAGFLVRDKIQLSGDVTVTAFEQQKGVIRVALVKSDEQDAGILTLVFSDEPLQLRQWTVTDGQGAMTRITLVDPQFGVPLDKKLFAFDPPDSENLRR